jgi:Fic family protein
MNTPRYEHYKDSGIEWLGEIPAHWSCKRLKYVTDINKVVLLESTSKNYEFDYIDISSVSLNKVSKIERLTFDISPSRARRVITKGDTILATVRPYLKAIFTFKEAVYDTIVSTGFAVVSPKPNLDFIYLLEAKDSSEIENIITTHDELFKEDLFGDFLSKAAAKEVSSYKQALQTGFYRVKETGLLTNQLLLDVQACIEHNHAGFRKLPGTALKNLHTGETVYTPPQHPEEVLRLMANLEKVINDNAFMDIESLVKMAVIHYQFESIHPFYDGNGRTGRILNILYLTLQGLLDLPILYLSRYIIRSKDTYYRLLQEVRDAQHWEAWILYMLDGVEQTAHAIIQLVQSIRALMADYKHCIREQFSFYSQDLLNNLFCHPYTKIAFVERDLDMGAFPKYDTRPASVKI